MIQGGKKEKNAIRAPAALIEQGEMARENDKAKKQKWYRSFSSRAGNILVRKSCRNKSVYGDYRCLYIGVGGGGVRVLCEEGELFLGVYRDIKKESTASRNPARKRSEGCHF